MTPKARREPIPAKEKEMIPLSKDELEEAKREFAQWKKEATELIAIAEARFYKRTKADSARPSCNRILAIRRLRFSVGDSWDNEVWESRVLVGKRVSRASGGDWIIARGYTQKECDKWLREDGEARFLIIDTKEDQEAYKTALAEILDHPGVDFSDSQGPLLGAVYAA